MKGFCTRDYTREDYNAVQNIWLQTGMGGAERGDDADTIDESLKLGGRMILLTDERTGEIIGSSWMTFDGRRIHLHHFGILPYFQGKGLSKLLLQASLKHVKEKGCQVKLEVHNTNIKAINLYSKNGFNYLGDYDVYIIRDLDTIGEQDKR